MPDYGAIGRGIEQAGQSIAYGLRERAQAKQAEREAENRRRMNKIVAQAKVRALGAQWTPEHDQMIQAGGSADDVASAAAEELKTKKAVDAARQAELDRQRQIETQAREASTGVERAKGLLKNPQFNALPPDSPQRQSIADAYLHGTIAQQQEAAKALEPPKPEKPSEGEIERQRKQAHRAQLAKALGADLNDPQWRYFIQEGGERPGSKSLPGAGPAAGGEFEKLSKPYMPTEKELAADSTLKPRGAFSPERAADSAVTYGQNVGRVQAEAAGVEAPDAQGNALKQQIDAVRQEVELLTEIRDRLKGKP